MVDDFNRFLPNEFPLTDEPNIDAATPRAAPANGDTRWRMRFAAVALACLPFVILETSLRIVAGPTAAVEGIDNDPHVNLHQLRPLFQLNAAGDQWEIPASRYNFFRPESFPTEKGNSTRRIFVLGGSTVQGRPFSTETAFSTWLKLRLQAADPAWQYEVINCGGVSYASYRVAKILTEVLQHQPDAIVLYTGHNEFLEDRTYAQVRDANWAQRVANTVAAKSKTVAWIKRQFTSASTNSKSSVAGKATLSAEVDARLDHAGGLDLYQRDPIWRRAVEDHFRSKLSQIVQAVRGAGVPLVLCVPASDVVDTPPIKTQRKSDFTKQEATQFITRFDLACDSNATIPARIQAARDCLAMDDQHSGAHYVLGRLLYQTGKTTAARVHLIAARDFDVCPLRATSPIVQSVREAGQHSGIMLVDTESLFDRRGPNDQPIADQIPDPDRFADHLHPTIAGHQLIGQQIARKLTSQVWRSTQKNSENKYQTLAKQHLDSLDEAYYARGKQRLEGLHRWATGRAGELGTQTKMP